MTPSMLAGALLLVLAAVAVGAISKAGQDWGEWAAAWAFAIGLTAIIVVGALLVTGEM